MKVTGQSPNTAKELTEQAKSKGTSRETPSDQPAQLNGTGPVKTSAFTLNKIKERIAVEPEIRQDRVAELKSQIESGQYKVDVQGLAEKMINESLQEDN